MKEWKQKFMARLIIAEWPFVYEYLVIIHGLAPAEQFNPIWESLWIYWRSTTGALP